MQRCSQVATRALSTVGCQLGPVTAAGYETIYRRSYSIPQVAKKHSVRDNQLADDEDDMYCAPPPQLQRDAGGNNEGCASQLALKTKARQQL